MKTRLKIVLSFLTGCLFLSSCNFYRPAILNAPVLEKKGEAVVGAAIVNGLNVSGAYAITDRFSISGNAAFHGGEYSNKDFGNGQETISASSEEYELAVGHRTVLKEGHILSLTAGYSAGKTGSFYNTGEIGGGLFFRDFYILSDYTQQSLLGAAQFKVGYRNYFGLVSKISSIQMRNFRTSPVPASLDLDLTDRNHLISQFAFQFSSKRRFVEYFTQFQLAFTDADFYNSYFIHRTAGLHLGFRLRIDQLINGSKEKAPYAE